MPLVPGRVYALFTTINMRFFGIFYLRRLLLAASSDFDRLGTLVIDSKELSEPFRHYKLLTRLDYVVSRRFFMSLSAARNTPIKSLHRLERDTRNGARFQGRSTREPGISSKLSASVARLEFVLARISRGTDNAQSGS